jgi:glycosyltransferase involved in cell wall biosynthesis
MICLTVIARNESRCLARCLESAAPFVDEMLVVDTGSTDDTRDIAIACGARVAEFTWVDDFAAARNYALAHTGAAWRLVLDADEWIEGGGPSLRDAVAGGCAAGDDGTKGFVGEISIRSAFDDGANVRFAPSWIPRFLPKGPVFEGRIHEQIVHRLPVRRLPLRVGHDGYRLLQQQGKGDRNERLLYRQLQDDPGNSYLRYQLGKDLQVHERYAQACGQYRQAREQVGWPPADAAGAMALQARYGWLHDLVVRELYCLKRSRDFATAVLYAQAQAPWWQQSPDFHFAFGDLLLDFSLAEPQRAAQLLPIMEASWMRCLELGEAPHLEGAVEGRGSFLAAHNLGVFHELTGNAVKAEHFRRLADPARP